jgi:hypothetical protein
VHVDAAAGEDDAAATKDDEDATRTGAAKKATQDTASQSIFLVGVVSRDRVLGPLRIPVYEIYSQCTVLGVYPQPRRDDGVYPLFLGPDDFCVTVAGRDAVLYGPWRRHFAAKIVVRDPPSGDKAKNPT